MRSRSENPPFVIFVGTNGTGKSTKMAQFLASQNRNLVIPANQDDSKERWGHITQVLKPEYKWVKKEIRPGKHKPVKKWFIPMLNTFRGNAKIHLEHNELEHIELFQQILDFNSGYKNGGLFCDDFKNYIIAQGKLPGWVSNVFRNRRHKNISIYMAAHHFSHVNAEMLDFGPAIGICKTRRTPNKSFLEKMDNQDEFMEVYRRVQERSNDDPYYCEKFEIN